MKKPGSIEIPVRRLALQFGFILLVISASTYKLEGIPSPWWDEGWTLNVARNWVEFGHYGQMLDSQPVGPGQSASFMVVAPVALSFRLLGIGIWQGRLPSVLFLLGALALLHYLADKMYNRPVAWGTLFVVFLMSGMEALHPLNLGRTVMGEMPMLFFLLAGYAFLLWAVRGPGWLIVLAATLWGIALRTKAQALPFWMVSLLLPLGVSLLKRWRRETALLIFGLIFTSGAFLGIGWVEGWINHLNEGVIQGLYAVTALVLSANARRTAVAQILICGLPTLLALGFSFRKSLLFLRQKSTPRHIEILRLSLLGYAGSCSIWYILLSVAFARYLFPAVFIGSIFVSAFLYELTFKFHLKRTFENVRNGLFHNRDRASLGAVLALLLVIISTTLTSLYLFLFFTHGSSSVLRVADYLNTHTDQDTLIETYESEIFFLLNRPYHYPPDELIVQVIQNMFLGGKNSLDYDPLSGEPEYLVVGDFGRKSKIYDTVLQHEFRLIQSYPGYEIYSRAR